MEKLSKESSWGSPKTRGSEMPVNWRDGSWTQPHEGQISSNEELWRKGVERDGEEEQKHSYLLRKENITVLHKQEGY